MADKLGPGMAFLAAKRHAYMASEVVYSRGETTLTIQATRGRREYEGSGGGTPIVAQSCEWLVRSQDLSPLGSSPSPKVGDRITETVGGLVRVYEVMRIGGGEHYRLSDANDLRLHTRMIQERAA